MLIPTFILLLALIINSASAADAAREALCSCAVLIVPSLFPFFVLSMLLNRLGLSSRLSGLIPFKGISAFLMGITGGYPLGASAVAELKQSGELTQEEADLLLPCCNNTGPAFIIAAVGAGVFASVKLGLMLYGVHTLSALIVWSMLGFKKGSASGQSENVSFSAVFPDVVRQSVLAVLNVCGFVVCFTVLLRLIRLDLICAFLSSRIGSDAEYLKVFLTGFAELGSGVSALKALPKTPEALALASFILGFGGLSVQCQTAAAVQSAGLDMQLHFWGRVLAGSIGAVITYILSVFLI